MKRRYIFIILSILLIGFAIVIFLNQPETTSNETKNSQTKTEKASETVANEEPENLEEAPAEEEKEPTAQIKEIISDAVQKTIKFFTNNERHVVAIGDSLTKGVGDHVVDGGYVGILDKTLNKEKKLVNIDNYGKRGNRSGQLLKRLDKPEIEDSIADADIVLVTIGANDIMKVIKENFTGLTLSDFTDERSAYKERLNNILEKINSLNNDTAVYLIGFYNPFEKYLEDVKELSTIVGNWNSTGKKVAKQYENVTFIPTADLFRDTTADLTAEDNFHPNHQGYQLMAERVMEYITE